MTHEGLSDFDPQTGKVLNYSEADRLPALRKSNLTEAVL
jgi:hypothetical protein